MWEGQGQRVNLQQKGPECLGLGRDADEAAPAIPIGTAANARFGVDSRIPSVGNGDPPIEGFPRGSAFQKNAEQHDVLGGVNLAGATLGGKNISGVAGAYPPKTRKNGVFGFWNFDVDRCWLDAQMPL